MQSTQNRTRAAARWLVQLAEVAEQRLAVDLSGIEGLREQSGEPVERALVLAEAAIQVLDAVLAAKGVQSKIPAKKSKKESIIDEQSGNS